MAEHGLIAAYRHDLLARLPADLANEVSDGLTDAYEQFLLRGLNPDQAAMAAIGEFGQPRAVADAFRRACPVFTFARTLIFTGPIVGGCWGAALITSRAWDWPIPAAARLLVGLVLAASIAMLATASRTNRYQSLLRAGIAGCLGIAVLDCSVVIAVMSLAPRVGWMMFVAVCISAARLTFVARSLCRYLARRIA